jgi:hypothetical protein
LQNYLKLLPIIPLTIKKYMKMQDSFKHNNLKY